MGGLHRMQKHLVRKGLVVGIIGLLMLVGIPQTVSAEDLPDLIVEDIKKDVGSMPKDKYWAAKVTNIGDGPTGSFIEIRGRITWMLFGIIPIKQVYSKLYSYVIGDLEPGESSYFNLILIQEIPSIRFGSYRFECTVNPIQTLEESQYFNNDYTEMFYVVNWFWFNKDLIDEILN